MYFGYKDTKYLSKYSIICDKDSEKSFSIPIYCKFTVKY